MKLIKNPERKKKKKSNRTKPDHPNRLNKNKIINNEKEI